MSVIFVNGAKAHVGMAFKDYYVAPSIPLSLSAKTLIFETLSENIPPLNADNVSIGDIRNF